MKPLLKGKGMIKICIPIVEKTIDDALTSIKVANRLGDLIEIRADYLNPIAIEKLFLHKEIPWIFTNRRKEEGGRWRGSEEERFEVLKKAVDFGVDYIDVELRSGVNYLKDLLKERKKVRVILSFHEFRGTPSESGLKRIFERMRKFRPDFIKIVTFAKDPNENLRVLSLIPYAKGKGEKLLAFCMGDKGKISRILSPLLGSPWAYGSIDNDKRSAPGQLTVNQMREVYKILEC
jgi:3-dehydroquinate dehydratase type I